MQKAIRMTFTVHYSKPLLRTITRTFAATPKPAATLLWLSGPLSPTQNEGRREREWAGQDALATPQEAKAMAMAEAAAMAMAVGEMATHYKWE